MMVRSLVCGLVGGFLMLSSQFASAQVPGNGATLPPATVSDFQANPGQLLSQFRDGGPDLTKQVIDLVGSDKATLATIIALAKTANEDQRKAIANGLAQVAKAYAQGDPGFANQIQLSVANSGLPEFAKAYAEAAGDTGTASTGGGGGGGGGGPTTGGPTGGQNGAPFNGGNNFAANGTPNLLNGGSLGGGGFSQISPF
jgi:hypothetical protein